MGIFVTIHVFCGSLIIYFFLLCNVAEVQEQELEVQLGISHCHVGLKGNSF